MKIVKANAYNGTYTACIVLPDNVAFAIKAGDKLLLPMMPTKQDRNAAEISFVEFTIGPSSDSFGH